MDAVKVRKVKTAKAEAGALTCKEAAASYRVKRPKVTESAQKRAAKARDPKKLKPASDDSWFTSERICAFIDSRCKTKKSTLAFFKEIGLTYNEKGEPVVVPR